MNTGYNGARRPDLNSLNQEATHNLYNINTNQTARYDSADELKTPGSEDERSYIDESERLRLPSKHGSLEGAYRRKSREVPDLTRYGSLEYNLQERNNYNLPQLIPSRFGSKRESTAADCGESNYQIIDMPPPPPGLRESDTDSMSQSGSSTQDFPPPPPPAELMAGYTQCNSGPTDQDSGHSSVRSSYMETNQHSQSHSSVHGGSMNSSQQWYECGDSPPNLRQQPPPHTPHYEVPPQTFVAQDSMYQRETHAATDKSPQQVMTVTKYQSYVEVSKPFEMSDFYKYSERLRKQRTVQTRQHKMEAVLSGEELQANANSQNASFQEDLDQSQNTSGLYSGGAHGSSRYPPSYVSSPGSMSPGSYGSPVRPSSPFTTGARSGSPFSHSHDGSYSMQKVTVRTRTPYSVQSSLVSYHSQTYQGSTPSPPVAQQSPRQMPYTPPQPQTCEPILDSPSSSTPQGAQRLVSPQ